MPKARVLLLGATGETGGDILDGLLADGSFDVDCLIQPSSASKPSVQSLKDRGLKIVIGNLTGTVDDLVDVIKGYDTIISAIGATQQQTQIKLVDAAAKVAVKRFVPCGFTIVCPPGGVMSIRDDKEEVYQRIWYHHLPYTIIDVGYWHQISWPRLPSGRLDYAMLRPQTEIYGDGNAPSILTDKRDIGHFVALIIKDERTLNKKVFTYSDVLSQNQIVSVMEEKSGEKVEWSYISEEELLKRREKARAEYVADPTNLATRMMRSITEYSVAKYIRRDNTPENGKYLGYLDARRLYPDFKPIRFVDFVDELLAGKAQRPYVGRF
ncbi:NAD(P)-binding protein [Zopfia rhizophila CBS 207.26]|uniref:NAD(P)-binding protein n=1 Tax=Zopfia rhizophila CBS 207.26 TaxID=1314779 RepID=A0A6A6DB90_9PEZI|nr:NAD(P)-binding protein [Zopfia rhizophila CBS 207.26]